MVSAILAILIAYVIGSVPTAYYLTRIATGKDIRTLGSGNVGAHNVYENVNLRWAIVTGLIDVGKAVLAVFIAQQLNPGAILVIMGAALAVVIGHIWPIFLKFSGGNGIACTIGILLMLMTKEVLIAIAIALLIIAITRNPILSINISLLITIPVAGSLITHNDPWFFYLGFALILISILVSNFIPTMRKALAQAGSKEKMAADLMRIQQEEPQNKGANKRKKRKIKN